MRILVVEDDLHLLQQIKEVLTGQGYVVDTATDGEQAHYMGSVEPFDAVVLDLGLPQIDGLTVLKRWRAENMTMPVLILTARDSWHEKVSGMDAGADDYVTKPFHTQELLARIRALLRRATGHASATLLCGELVLDTRQSQFFLDHQSLVLTGHEYKVLAYLMHRQGQVVSRTELTEHIYAQDQDRDSNTIDVFIGRLRKKLPSDYIQTVRGLGYKLVEPHV
ncbi:response regulator transcription factor [uncultured Paenalcaligenes sp.]|uniref:response regulator transcription factor n=1 Tax=uncultured Paenalcaligenes sp. TaxID=1588925 RepID=UPI0026081B71|nr:response regulator transcription factor [uncultured Paenalcaligenes sp.]